MEGRDLWASARKSFVRVGYYYLCKGCKRLHLDLSCGFFLTEDGAVATAYHVLEQDRTMRKGCLIVVDDEGTVYPVAEIAAAIMPGLVSTILALQDDEEGVHSKRQHSTAKWMVLHEAVSAREVKALIRASDREGEHG
jgi:hypothetical protein